MSDQAVETPLTDLLARVPRDAVASYEHGPTEHSRIPYGHLCARANAEIARLQTELKNLDEAFDALYEQSSGTSIAEVMGVDKLQAEVARLTAECAELRYQVECRDRVIESEKAIAVKLFAERDQLRADAANNIRRFVQSILHGDNTHRAWLQTAAEEFIAAIAKEKP